MELSKSSQLNQEVIDGCKSIHAAWNERTKTWTLPIIHGLGLQAPARFNELKRRIDGISATSLAERVNELDRRRIAQREAIPITPPRGEHSLTKTGIRLNEILGHLA